MGPAVDPAQPDPSQIDAWLSDGGLVVGASDRAARAAQMAYHHRRRNQGATAWSAPAVLSWTSFISSAWDQHARDERMLLNPAQEIELWTAIIGRERHLVTALDAPRRRMARLAADAHALLCAYAPRFLQKSTRSSWDRDPAAFSRWLSAFDDACAGGAFLSQSRLELELVALLQRNSTVRAPILLLGFDRLLPIQKAVFDAWGTTRVAQPGPKAGELHLYEARETDSELNACAAWCVKQLARKADARLLVLSQEISDRRGEIERAFLRAATSKTKPLFEFSLGVPLQQIPLVRAAFLLLRWLDGPLTETEVDWLFASSYGIAAPEESAALQAHMRAVRRRNLARPDWTLDALLQSGSLPSAWVARIHHAQRLLSAARSRVRAPLEWAALAPDLLRALGLPSEHSFSSPEFQAWQRWEDALDICASLGFDGRRISWADFLPSLQHILESTLFAPESTDTPIQIAGPGESAGLTADGIWFLGADEDAWPASGSANPLLPLPVQRDFAMPHASPRHDAELAAAITGRIITTAPVVNFSYASLRAEAETRPSRSVAQIAGSAHPLPADLASAFYSVPQTVTFEDTTRVAFAGDKAPGGSSVLTAQSQCAFKSFAIARLDAKPWEPAEFGLSTSQRGLLLHEVMHAVWGGPPEGFHSLQDLRACNDLTSFVTAHVERVLETKLPDELRDRVPQRYLALEATRLSRLITEWLQYEAARHSFTVLQTEVSCKVSVAGLALDLRMDRTDELRDGSVLVIDYKTGSVNPKNWDLPRPDDVQLPLYAGFACNTQVGGLVFAKLRAGNMEFAGKAIDTSATLVSGLSGNNGLIKYPLTPEKLADWSSYIEQLALDFIAGRADLDPRDYPKTCDNCGLHAICRIHENWLEPEPEEEDELPYD